MSILICMLVPNSIRYGNVILWLSVFNFITHITENIVAVWMLILLKNRMRIFIKISINWENDWYPLILYCDKMYQQNVNSM